MLVSSGDKVGRNIKFTIHFHPLYDFMAWYSWTTLPLLYLKWQRKGGFNPVLELPGPILDVDSKRMRLNHFLFHWSGIQMWCGCCLSYCRAVVQTIPALFIWPGRFSSTYQASSLSCFIIPGTEFSYVSTLPDVLSLLLYSHLIYIFWQKCL
jgi:hypothetical protein